MYQQRPLAASRAGILPGLQASPSALPKDVIRIVRSVSLDSDDVQVVQPDPRLTGLLQRRLIMEAMTTPPRRHLASSPFRREPEPTIEHYELNDLVSHDSYGMGRVIQLQTAAVVVDFGSQTVRVPSPFHKMAKL